MMNAMLQLTIAGGLLMTVTLAAAPAAAQGVPRVEPGSIAQSRYVVVKDGHLSLDGQRQRYWAVIGQVYGKAGIKPGDSPEQRRAKVEVARRSTDLLLQRFEDLGFNATRLWTGFNQPTEYEVGDGSEADSVDYFLKRAGERGFKVWLAGTNSVGHATAADVGVVDDPATAAAWSAAVASAKDGRMALSRNLARYWDPRLEALGIQRMSNVATHFNRHTGLRWADDPTIIVWELSNEEWWISKMVGGQWQQLPPFFRNALVGKWNAFLKERYGDDEKLAAAWGKLLPGESIAAGTVLLAPMRGATPSALSINDASAQARAALDGLPQEHRREDFAPERGRDVLRFFVGMHVKHKQKEHAALRGLGRSTALSPWIYDTGIGYEVQSQWLHQHADAVAHDAYVNGVGQNVSQRQWDAATNDFERDRLTLEQERQEANVPGGWNNWLLKPPGISQGVPWLEHNRVEGLPFLCYETQIQQPAKYRADFPLRLAALASIQDWDFVCWHYFGDPSMHQAAAKQRPFDQPLDVTTGGHPQGYHYTYDEVQNAMMRAAGLMWRSFAFDKAQSPTTFIYGSDTLFDPASMNYGHSYGRTGLDMLQTTYQHGVRIRIDPTRDTSEVIGPVVRFEDRHTHNPYTPTPQITFDWKQGFVKMDAPAAASFTGLLARTGDTVTFNSGVTLRDVTIHNPPGIFDPVRDDERYLAFALHSTDGRPLQQTRHAALSLVSTSFNTGFTRGGATPDGKKTPNQRGTLPVLVARVGATIEAPALDGMRFTLRDWHMQKIGAGVVQGGRLTLTPDQPVFVVELER